MTPTDVAFYAEESLAYRGLWKLPMDADDAAILVYRLLKACGERRVQIRLVPRAEHHAALAHFVQFVPGHITPQCVIHEVAHVVAYRNAGEHIPEHDATLWNLIALLSCIVEEVL